MCGLFIIYKYLTCKKICLNQKCLKAPIIKTAILVENSQFSFEQLINILPMILNEQLERQGRYAWAQHFRVLNEIHQEILTEFNRIHSIYCMPIPHHLTNVIKELYEASRKRRYLFRCYNNRYSSDSYMRSHVSSGV